MADLWQLWQPYAWAGGFEALPRHRDTSRLARFSGDGVGTAYTSRLPVNAEEWTAAGSQRRDRRGDDARYLFHLRK